MQNNDIILDIMTICIACLSDDGKKVVVGTDNMITHGSGTATEYHREIPTNKKLKYLNDKVVLMYSGNPDMLQPILNGLNIQKSTSPKEAMNLVFNQYEKILKERQEREILAVFGLDWDSYLKKQNQFAPSVVMDIHTKLQNLNSGIEIVVAGFDGSSDECYVAVISGRMVIDRNALGIAWTGNGGTLAQLSLLNADYNKSMKSDEVQKLVEQALETAKHASGVGSTGDCIILPQ